ncbi:basic region leucine zipper [Dictyocaulus viviparus]|uniref:Basic region leucine zipper n=1 Tax=Dictyocaulus viviparus TaxID=29172 RepID=A0A0D8YBY3_DICVI|nr:basic region leucine zipper [Dictyocaulus viviparus]
MKKHFDPKDSLARAASLQECDRKRDPEGILDFLETTMNIEDYLEDITFTPNNAHADDIDFDDFELKNYNILLKDDKTRLHSEHRPFGHNGIQEELNSGGLCSPSTSASSYVSKKEMRISQQPEVYTPTTTARKYRLKTPQERNNTSYKVKRQRNNDAVRKSRSKAKQLQLMKEKQLQDALLEVSQLKEKLRVVNEKLLHCRCRR